jgi:aconitate hydratase
VALPDLARAYRDAGVSWLAVGDENYGEGSSREHAAMEPRFLGGRAVLVRSFARIHEANLKKQGVLALTFADPSDYDKVRVDDVVDVLGLAGLAPGSTVTVVLRHSDATTDEIAATHTMSEEHIAWFKAGSALNLLRQQRAD